MSDHRRNDRITCRTYESRFRLASTTWIEDADAFMRIHCAVTRILNYDMLQEVTRTKGVPVALAACA
jgi:hypothetical protein